jgi:hypothetical protein
VIKPNDIWKELGGKETLARLKKIEQNSKLSV